MTGTTRDGQLSLYAERNAGQAANLAAAVSVLRDYRHHAETALAELADSGQPFTADDVHARIPSTTEPHHANVLPSLMGTWAATGRIRRVHGADRLSTRRTRHGSRNATWIGGAK